MKTLSKLNINPEKKLKQEELYTLRGGYGWVSCRIGGTQCYGGYVGDCGAGARAKCDQNCGGWDNLICAGV